MPTTEERIASLEAKVDGLADLRGMVSGLRDEVARRFDHVDRRFEQMDRRFDGLDQKVDRHFTWVAGILVGQLLAVVGALVGMYYR